MPSTATQTVIVPPRPLPDGDDGLLAPTYMPGENGGGINPDYTPMPGENGGGLPPVIGDSGGGGDGGDG